MGEKEKEMKESCELYLSMRGYSKEESEAIIQQQFKDYCCEVAYDIIHQDY